MNALDQTPVSPGTSGRCVVCPVGASAYRVEGTQTRVFPECYGRLATVVDVPGLPGWGRGCVLFIGLTAEPYHTHAVWYGMMNALGIFRMDRLVPEDLAVYTRQPHYFWLGEVGMAGVIAVPAGIYLAGRTGITRAFILAIIVFLPKLIQRGMQADAQAVVEAFGKNEHVMRVCWALVVAMIG